MKCFTQKRANYNEANYNGAKYNGTKNNNGAKGNNKGFTLLEALISLSLIAGVLITSVSFVKKKDTVRKKVFRQFVSLNRQLDHFARLKRNIYRLVIQIDKKEEKYSYWVEKKLLGIDLNNNSSEEEEGEDTTQDATEDATEEGSSFVIDTDFFEKPQVLPSSLSFVSVELGLEKDPVEEGKAYIFYFPDGQFNKVLIQVKERNIYWSFLINRLSGGLTILKGKNKLKDLEL